MVVLWVVTFANSSVWRVRSRRKLVRVVGNVLFAKFVPVFVLSRILIGGTLFRVRVRGRWRRARCRLLLRRVVGRVPVDLLESKKEVVV